MLSLASAIHVILSVLLCCRRHCCSDARSSLAGSRRSATAAARIASDDARLSLSLSLLSTPSVHLSSVTMCVVGYALSLFRFIARHTQADTHTHSQPDMA